MRTFDVDGTTVVATHIEALGSIEPGAHGGRSSRFSIRMASGDVIVSSHISDIGAASFRDEIIEMINGQA